MSRRKSHVSPSEEKLANPSTSAQFSLVNRAQGDHRGGTPSIGNETYLDIFGDDDGWGCWLVW